MPKELGGGGASLGEAVRLVGAVGAVKHTVTGNAISVVETALSLVGSPGLSRSNPPERHYRNVLCSRVHTPQDDAILLAAGTAALPT